MKATAPASAGPFANWAFGEVAMNQYCRGDAEQRHLKRSDVQIYASLLVFEWLCDAIAGGEFAEMGFGKTTARQSLIDAITSML